MGVKTPRPAHKFYLELNYPSVGADLCVCPNLCVRPNRSQRISMNYAHNRRSIRLKGYDYKQPGYYFVTLCANGFRSLFGSIEDGEVFLNDAGKMVVKWWNELFVKYCDIEKDIYCVMPNHFHGIIHIVGANLCVRPNAIISGQTEKKGQTHRSAPTSLGGMIQWFKTMSTNEYICNVKCKGWPPFDKRLWQRNYYEHIIRDDEDLNRIREYVVNNPAKWLEDEYYA